ncbi:MAG: trigger factor [Cytophagales bacterium]
MGVRVPPSARFYPLHLLVLNIKIDKKSETEAVIKVPVAPATYQPVFKKKLKEEAQKVQIKGFRPNSPNKVALIKRRFGKEVLKETVLADAEQQAHQYLDKHNIFVLGGMVPVKEAFAKIEWREGDTFTLPFEIDMAASFQLALDKQIEVDVPTITTVPKNVLKTHIERLQHDFGEKQHPEEVQLQDLVAGSLAYEKDKEERFSFVLDKGLLVKVDLTGRKVGDVVDLGLGFLKAVNPLFLERLEKKKKDLAKKLPFTIQKITRTVPLSLGPKFFDLILGPGVVKDLAGFEKKISERLLMRYQNQAVQACQRNIRQALVAKAKIVLPAKYKARQEEMAWGVIARYLCKEHKIEVASDELLAALSQRYHYMFASVPKEVREEMVKRRIQQDLEDPEKRSLNRIGGDVLATKLSDFIKEKITVQPKKITVGALEKLLGVPV